VRIEGVNQQSGITANDFSSPVTYRVIAQDNIERQNWVVNVAVAPNEATDILSFSFPEASGPGEIDTSNHTVEIELIYGTDFRNLVATFSLSPGATARINGNTQESGITENDFSDYVTYTITAEDGITIQDWLIIVEVAPNVETEIINFSFPEQTNSATISNDSSFIVVEVSPGTSLTSLIAYFNLSDGASAIIDGVIQVSGETENDFTDTLTYTVFAQDGGTKKDWKVYVYEQPFVDNEDPVISVILLPEEYPVGSEDVTASVSVTDNIGIGQVVFRYKRYQDADWKEIEVISGDSLYNFQIVDSLIGSHGLLYYFKAYDFKNNTDSTDVTSMVLRYNSQNSPEVPGLEFGASVENYQIISVPLSLDNNNVSEIFDELMPYNIKKWRLFNYNNRTTGEYPDAFTTMAAGKGYWLIVREEVSIRVGGGTTSRIENENGFAITLQPGWNQVGNPYNFEISWDDVIEFNGNDSIDRIKVYDNGILLETDEVPAFRGGFVFLVGDQSAFVNIPPNPGFKRGRISRPVEMDLNGIDQSSWFLPLQVIHGNFKNTLTGIGMHPESIPGFDWNDEPLLPVPGEISGFDMYFNHEGEKYEKLSKDVVNSTDFYVWEFTVNKYGNTGNISLQWNNQNFGDNEFNLILIDELNDRMVDMRAMDSYTFYATDIHNFKIYYGTDDKLSKEILPDDLKVGEIYPNPFEDVLYIPLTLPDLNESYEVEISLSDLKGNKILHLSPIHLGAGFHQISCNVSESLDYARGFCIVRIIISSATHKEIRYRKVLKQ